MKILDFFFYLAPQFYQKCCQACLIEALVWLAMISRKTIVYNGSGDSAIATLSTSCRRILKRIRALNSTINSTTFRSCEPTQQRRFLRRRKILRIRLRNLRLRRSRLFRLQEARVTLRRLYDAWMTSSTSN